MKNKTVNNSVDRLAPRASRAVGVGKDEDDIRHWVIGIVLNNTEVANRDRLIQLGYEAYVPTQIEVSVWKDGRKKKREKVLFKNFIFLHVTEKERREVLDTPFVRECYRYKHTYRKGNSSPNANSVVVIPESDMERMKFMLFQSETPITIEQTNFHKGDKVKVVRGNLQGLEGEILYEQTGTSLIVGLGVLGFAKVKIDTTDVEKLHA